jgi:hypothetical protein
MAIAMAMAGKQKKKNFGENLGTRIIIVVVGGLCMPHGHVIWHCGYSLSLNWQNVFLLLSAWLISRVIALRFVALALMLFF